MKKLRPAILSILLVSLWACTKTDKEIYGICGNPWGESESNAEFEGIFRIGQRDISFHEANIRYMDLGDTAGYFHFNLYELDGDSVRLGRTAIHWVPVNDTAYFQDSLSFGSSGPWLFYEKLAGTEVSCRWVNDSSGFAYTEQLDSLHYRVDCRALLEITESCSQFEPDTVSLRIQGVFRFIR